MLMLNDDNIIFIYAHKEINCNDANTSFSLYDYAQRERERDL